MVFLFVPSSSSIFSALLSRDSGGVVIQEAFCLPVLSNLFLKECRLGAFTTFSGRLFHIFVIRIVKLSFLKFERDLSLYTFKLWPLIPSLDTQVVSPLVLRYIYKCGQSQDV